MATLDELVVSIVLDAAGFTKGQRQTMDALDKTKKEAVASGAIIEQSMTKAGDAFLSLGRKALGLYALFTTGRGIKEFVADMTGADAALGRVAKNLDMSAKSLSTWQGAADVAGGSAEGITGALSSLSGAMQTAALTGTNSLAPVFRALGISLAGASGKARDVGDVLVDLNRASQGMDPARFNTMMKMIGLDDGTINLLEKSTSEFDRLRREQEKYAATAADVDAAQKRQTGWRELLLTSTSLGRTILTSLTPAITGAMRAVQDWATANQGWIKSAIVEYVGQFVGWLKRVDWQALGAQFKDLGTNVATIASAFASVVKAVSTQSPLVVAFEAFAVLLATRILAPLVAITRAIGALSGVPLTGVLAALGGASVLANNTRDEQADNGFAMSAGERAMRFVDGGLADRVYGKRGEQQPHGPHHGIGVQHQAPDQKQDGLWGRAKRALGLGGGSKPAPDVAGGMGAKGNLAVNQQTAYAAAIGEGLSPLAARALVADFSGESLANPHDHHWDRLHMSGGIGQWDPERAAAIKRQFGKVPWELSVPEQTRAAIWEYKTNPRFAPTKRAMEGNDHHAMIGALVDNYENPYDKVGAKKTRMAYFNGFQPASGSLSISAPVKVEMTDGSAFKVGKAFVSSSPLLKTDGAGQNTLAAIHASWQRYADAHGKELVHPGAARSWNGIGRHHGLNVGARAWSAVNHARHMTSHSVHHEETHVGELHVHPQTGDGQRFAGDFQHAARRRNSVVTQANFGLA